MSHPLLKINGAAGRGLSSVMAGRPQWKIVIILCAFCFNLGFAETSAYKEKSSQTEPIWLPGAPAPMGSFGLSVGGEYDRRWIGSRLITARRWLAFGGISPSPVAAFWLESGVATLDILEGETTFEGDYGLALGVGWTLIWPWAPLYGIKPFALGRALQTQSYIVRRQGSGATATEQHSRYQWQQAVGFIGIFHSRRRVDWAGGAAMRTLFQDEFRSTRTTGATDRAQYAYISGLRPGLMLGARFHLPRRMSLWVVGEAYAQAQKLTLTFSQWGWME